MRGEQGVKQGAGEQGAGGQKQKPLRERDKLGVRVIRRHTKGKLGGRYEASKARIGVIGQKQKPL